MTSPKGRSLKAMVARNGQMLLFFRRILLLKLILKLGISNIFEWTTLFNGRSYHYIKF
jgi:hypothetical protein